MNAYAGWEERVGKGQNTKEGRAQVKPKTQLGLQCQKPLFECHHETIPVKISLEQVD